MKMTWDMPPPNLELLGGAFSVNDKGEYFTIRDSLKGFHVLRVDFEPTDPPLFTAERTRLMQAMRDIALIHYHNERNNGPTV